jgi:hypothetical protein
MGLASLTYYDRGHLKEIIEQAFPERSRMGAPLDSWRIFEVYGGGVRLRSPTPDRGYFKEIINWAFPERSRMGAPLESWRIIEFYGGGVRLRSPTPDRGHLKEIIKRVFPERSRMGTLLAPLNPCFYGSHVHLGVRRRQLLHGQHDRPRKAAVAASKWSGGKSYGKAVAGYVSLL